MGIRLHELAKELGVQSKEFVAFCRELKAKGRIGKEVRTASSSLDAEDEAVVRLEYGSGTAGQAAADDGAKPVFKPAEQQPSPAPIRLMQSVASKPKGQSPTQLKRPQVTPAPLPRPTPTPKPSSAPPAPEPTEPPPPEPDEPAQPEPEAAVPESEVRVPSLPGAEKPEPAAPPPEVKVAALPGVELPKPEEKPAAPEPKPKARPAAVADAEPARPQAAPEPPAPPLPKEAEPEDATPAKPDTKRPAAMKKAPARPDKAAVAALPEVEPKEPGSAKEPSAQKTKPRERKDLKARPEAKGPAAEPTPAPTVTPAPSSTRVPLPAGREKAQAAVPKPAEAQAPPPAPGLAETVQPSPTAPAKPDTTQGAAHKPAVEAPPPPRPKPRPARPAEKAPVRKALPTEEHKRAPIAEPARGPARRPKRTEKVGRTAETSRADRSTRGRRGPERRPIPKPASSRPRPMPKDRKIVLQPPIVIKDISYETGIKAGDIIRKLLESNVMATINEAIDPETATAICTEFGFEVEIKKAKDVEESFQELIGEEEEDKPEDLASRAPVVTLLGHVDHGKTSLLDSIRRTNVAESESGGITQHIGAHQVPAGDRFVTFLDTPGHEAFTAMRARGANCTDVVVLVVAADDGVMPQTEEAVNHARAASVPIVVAINKIDKPNANVMRTKQQLAAMGLNPEEWGGDTAVVEVSAVTGQGVQDLLEMLALESELLELKASPNKPAKGVVLEAELSQGRGAEATLLVREGTLKRGDVALCGQGYGRVRGMLNDKGRGIKAAGPSTPTAVSGLSTVPRAGDRFFVVKDLQTAKLVAEDRGRRERMASLVERRHVTLESLFEHIEQGNVKEVRVVLKADVQGSVEVLQNALSNLGTDEVRTNVLHRGVGGISESDILLADASDAIIIGFHVTPEERARALAEEKGVDVRLYQVIYMAIEDMRKAMEGLLEPEEREEILGHAEIRRVFRISRHGSIAGCYVRDGSFSRTARLRVVRSNVVIYSGRMQSLRIEKDDAREVRAGQECGIKVEGYDDIKEGDVLEAYEVRQVARTFDT